MFELPFFPFSENVNFLVADGIKFAHPLHHLGKNKEDLPLIAIDSFRHMYLFAKYEDAQIPGKLKQFLQDLYSGKLHREFHYGPDTSTTSDEPASANEVNKYFGFFYRKFWLIFSLEKGWG